jgi:hypothetical protein
MDASIPAASTSTSQRTRKRPWPAVLIWASLILLTLHAGLLILVYAHLRAWLEPLSYLLVTPTGLLLLVGLPIVALALLCHLIFTFRTASTQKRVILTIQIVILIAVRIGLHFVPGGIFCIPLEAIGFRLGDGPKLQVWAQFVLANPDKAGVSKPSKEGFPGAEPGYEGNLPPDRLPRWIRSSRPNLAEVDLTPGDRSVAIGVQGGFGEWELVVGEPNLVMPQTDLGGDFRATRLWAGMYYCEGD